MNRLLTAAEVLLAVSCVILQTGCSDPCGNEIVSETKSPDARLKAVVFARDCGALTDFSTQISILASSASSPSWRGNLFIADDNNHAVPLNSKGAIKINVTWESNTSLSVSYPKNAQVSLKKSSVAGVSIRYDALP